MSGGTNANPPLCELALPAFGRICTGQLDRRGLDADGFLKIGSGIGNPTRALKRDVPIDQ